MGGTTLPKGGPPKSKVGGLLCMPRGAAAAPAPCTGLGASLPFSGCLELYSITELCE